MPEKKYDTPLVKKLGIKPGAVMHTVNAPLHYADLLGELPEDVKTTKSARPGADFIHIFVTNEADLSAALPKAQAALKKDGMIWVSWPKKASKVETDINEQTLRDILLPLNLVDIKVVAVDEVWSGLKFVWRKS